jgi:hypothetical protein
MQIRQTNLFGNDTVIEEREAPKKLAEQIDLFGRSETQIEIQREIAHRENEDSQFDAGLNGLDLKESTIAIQEAFL